MYRAFKTDIHLQSYNTDNITSHSTYLNLRIWESDSEPCSGQTKDYIKLVFVSSSLTTLL